ncbi:MAG TPA: glycosyltransferase family A protein [Elusimicrobiota bacterium]|nr:glycosyltransferase family A protein [Elusimicrobiota bacterium]
MARIDVLLPVKNGVQFLAPSLDSLIAQSFTDWRVLVLDHGSTDGSRELAARYRARDPRVELHSFPDAKGLAGLLNRGLDIADCEYVLRHDADDVCFPDRMAALLDAFASREECVALGGNTDVIDGTGVHVGAVSMPTGAARLSAASLFRTPIVHPTAMLRFDALRRLGARYGRDFLKALPPERSMEVDGLAEDYFLFGQLAMLGRCDNLPKKLILYRRHGASVSATKYKDQMAMSLRIARFLTRSLCAMHALPWFDPAPFANHGGEPFDVDGRIDFDADFERMARAVRRAFGSSAGVERELTFRRVVANRRGARMLWRYHRFRAAGEPERVEWGTVKAFLLRHLPGRGLIRIASEAAEA